MLGHHCDEDGEIDGSMGPASYDMLTIKGTDIKSQVCFFPMVTAREKFLIRLYQHYKVGHLYGPGGLMEQPDRYLIMMELIEQASHQD